MINDALAFLCYELNAYFKLFFNIKEDRVIVSSPLNVQGSANEQNTNKVIITLVRIEQETINRNIASNRVYNQGASANNGQANDAAAYMSPPLNLNLHLLFSTSFSDYSETLKFISYTISFFQAKNVFNHQNAPLLSKRIEKLILELENTNYQDSSFLWGMLGSKYTPSVMYKMRMLTIQEGMWRDTMPLISNPEQKNALS